MDAIKTETGDKWIIKTDEGRYVGRIERADNGKTIHSMSICGSISAAERFPAEDANEFICQIKMRWPHVFAQLKTIVIMP